MINSKEVFPELGVKVEKKKPSTRPIKIKNKKKPVEIKKRTEPVVEKVEPEVKPVEVEKEKKSIDFNFYEPVDNEERRKMITKVNEVRESRIDQRRLVQMLLAN